MGWGGNGGCDYKWASQKIIVVFELFGIFTVLVHIQMCTFKKKIEDNPLTHTYSQTQIGTCKTRKLIKSADSINKNISFCDTIL